ncbi:hypothetical protein [Streptomyces sp. 135]|uniref:hypothetical protein n=1 Tax=Streptomyces sp. 135 TaxID=2838850 RepID=UPI001CBC0D48|nr:hypothetical protein [Streptomyces sp. 135]
MRDLEGDIEVRAVTDAEPPVWVRAAHAGFLYPLAGISDEAVAHTRARGDIGGMQGPSTAAAAWGRTGPTPRS